MQTGGEGKGEGARKSLTGCAILTVKLKFPLVSILLGVVLGGMAETNFRQALRISDGSLMIFIERPVCAVMLILGLLMMIAPLLIRLITRR